MRILMLGYEFPSTLNEPVVSGEVKNPTTLAYALSARGHDVTIVSVPFLSRRVRRTGSRSAASDFRVLDVPEGRGKGALRYVDRVGRVARALHGLDPSKFDVVHAQAPALALAVRWAGRDWRQAPVVVTGHGTNLPEADADASADARQRLRALNARAVLPVDIWGFNSADVVVSVSEYQRRELRDYYRVPVAKIKVIHNGVDSTRYVAEAPPGGNRVLFVGRMAPKKGLGRLLRAFRLVKEALPGARLTIVGGTETFNFLGSSIKHLISDLDLDSSVDVVMDVPEARMPEYYRECDVLVAPSEGYESLPTVILEAMSCQRPVVATRSWGTPEALGDRHPGLLDTASETEISGRVIAFLTDENLRELAVGEQDQRFTAFALDHYVDAHLTLYDQLMRRRHRDS